VHGQSGIVLATADKPQEVLVRNLFGDAVVEQGLLPANG
jgi:hypothetical protein